LLDNWRLSKQETWDESVWGSLFEATATDSNTIFDNLFLFAQSVIHLYYFQKLYQDVVFFAYLKVLDMVSSPTFWK